MAESERIDDASILDQHQDPKQRRELRHQYRSMIQDVKENREEMMRPDSNRLQEMLLRSSDCFENVQQTSEAVMDSSLMATLATIGKQKAQAVHTNLVRYHPAEFTEKLVTFLNERRLPERPTDHHEISEEGWEKLGKCVQPFFKRSPPLHILYGALEKEEPVRKQRSKNAEAKKDKSKGPATAPEKLKNFKSDSEQETTTVEVERILGILRNNYNRMGRKPMCVFEFLVNPDSFSQTVENIFYFSFLIKDNHARMFLDENKLPVIEPVFAANSQGGELERHQTILTLSKPEWKEIVEAFDIREPVIPTRQRKHHT